MPEYEVHVVSHTHWDREWYRTFEQFRFRLVRLVDKLLDILDADPEYRYFMLDGQTVVLEDYLEIRPEREEDLRRLVQAGRIQIGPWYILPDEFLVSGEATIRNMLAGWRVASRFGEPMKVGYIPDTFGHLSQMPQILRGFGIDTAVFWRGLSGGPEAVRSEFLWRAPDGSTVLAVHLPDEYGYGSFADMPTEVEPAVENVRRKLAVMTPHATTPYILLMNGTDHLEPKPELPRVLSGVNETLGDAILVHSTLPAFLEKVKSAATDLKVYQQEFRDTNRKPGCRYNFVLAGVLSARIYLKQANQACETELERWAEPFSSIAWRLGSAYPEGFLRYAWQQLLRNHPHDSICGCSIDEVHREMETRFAKVQQVTGEIVGQALADIAGRIDVSDLAEGEGALVVFNPLGWSRDDLVVAKVHTAVPYPRGADVRDLAGRRLPAKLLAVEPAPALPPYRGQGSTVTIAFPAKGVPALGYQTYRYRVLARPIREAARLVVGPRSAENDYLRVEIRGDGSVAITDKLTGHAYAGCNVFEDGGDVGDEYTYAAPTQDRIILSSGQPCAIALVDDGPAKATFLVDYDLALPDGEAGPDGRARSDRLISNRIQTWVTLAADARRVDVETRVENQSRDHRLRVLFPSGVRPKASHAESAFDVVTRPLGAVQPDEVWIEDAPTYHPLATFVDVNDGGRGLAIANRGLPEYEVRPDGVIAITLVRAVGWLGRISPSISLNAGPHLATPDAQCLRTTTFNYSIIPHAGGWLESRAHQQAYHHLAPLRAVPISRQSGQLPGANSFLDLGCDELILTAVKRSKDGRALILRAYNPADGAVRARVRPGFAYSRVSVANLAEEAQEDLLPDGDAIALDVQARGIVTLRLE